MEKSIIGKRVILFAFEATELKHFVELHRADKNGMLGRFCLKEMTQEAGEAYFTALILSGQIRIWSCYTKNGKASQKIGYLYLDDITPLGCSLIGILDKSITKGLIKILKSGKYSWSEDAVRTLCNYIFENGINRVEYAFFSGNKLSENLAKKCGFSFEGIKRQCFKFGEELRDIHYYSLLKSDLNKEATNEQNRQ
ncbi:MAG TPA: GNAT family protein [Candidatus Cloacimonas sp.]|nr:GNAT family protein [Candidatus Cloacimonas sp.]